MHDPDNFEAAAEARRVGGVRRRREGSVAGVYEIENLNSIAALQRVLMIALLDSLGLENSIARARVLTGIVQAGQKLLEAGDVEERLVILEGIMAARQDRRRLG